MAPTATSATTAASSRTRSVAFIGLSIALMAVSAWVTVPLGPVPFTLQTFVMVFAVLALEPRQALAAIAIYLLMGAVGLPMFSGMRGGLGMLAGPTGGFLWGFLLGAAAAVLVLRVAGAAYAEGRGRGMRPLALDVAAAAVFLAVCYACGWVQLMAVANMAAAEAFAAAIAPFVLVDVAKLAAAVVVARAVRRAVGPR